MTSEEHKQIMNDLLKCVASEHQATATELMTKLTDDYGTTLADLETTKNNNETLTANNEKLRSVNAELFLKVGTPKNEVENKKENPTNTNTNDIPSFESLFNEKGELI